MVATIDTGGPGRRELPRAARRSSRTVRFGVLDKEPSPLQGGKVAKPAAEEAAPKEDEGEGTSTRSGERRGDEGGARDDCHPYEYHLVVHTKGKIRARQLLTEACNNGYGFAGVGEDDISVDAETQDVHRRQSGGLELALGQETTTLGLDPFRVVSNGQVDVLGARRGRNVGVLGPELRHLSGDGDAGRSPDCEGRRKQDEAARSATGAGRTNRPRRRD